ncbi:LysR family transcriptional regulator [Brenneria tiliae]|uniref:LysR family transcriptional regulator n=1 Tax=Brenneria tiliae TaxID=2914984 RepID=UPI002014BEE2|nr:LysR family transcriptional regulator [Brenneria tiliae]MCL2896372.1 LysR family transcriptional regulator [Brenneria tiliae]MCL2900860.1 LysR family transcriptional regulator [Brenneria tiliae]
MKSVPNLKDVSDLIAVVEAGGFRGAAVVRRSSASSLSDAIRRLEADLGIRLLNRTTRSVTPTEAGARLIERLKPAFSEIEAAFNDLQDDANRPLGTLRLNVPVPIARHVLPGIASGFLERFPSIRLDVVMENDFSDVIGRGFDAGVRYEERIAKDMIAIPIGPRRQRFVAAASASYIEKYGLPDHPRTLPVQHRLIGNRFSSGAIWPWVFERDGELLRIMPDGPLISSSIDLQLACAVSGAGIVYTFEDFLRPHLESGEIVLLLEEWWQEFDGPYLYYPSRRHMPSPLRAFVDYIKELNAGRNG